MSGYGIGEAALATLIANVTGYTAGNVTRGKWGVLNTGKAAKYAIIKPGDGARLFETHNMVTENWRTVVQVWHRYRDDGTTLTDLEADVEALLAKIDKNNDLGDTTGYVQYSDAVNVGECQEMWKRGGGPSWLRQDITISWTGQRVITFE